MRKVIATLLSIIILLNLFDTNTFASSIDFGGKAEGIQEEQEGITKNNIDSSLNSGKVETYGDQMVGSADVNTPPSFLEGITSLAGNILAFIPATVNNILSFIVYGNISQVFTIQGVLTNEYGIFDINFFKDLDEDTRFSEEINLIKHQVATWYVSIRNIAAVGIAIIAIYIGIRMAISSVADQKAKYKKMFIFWIEALALLYLLQYFIIILLNISEVLVNFMIKGINGLGDSKGIEESIIKSSIDTISGAKGAGNTLISVILYFMLVYYELKFFIIYISRVFRIGFYMVISPLVSLTYPIDKMGDGRAQAFKKWISEYTMEIFLQPIHLGLYLVFMFSAGEIIKATPFLGIVFLSAIGNGEKIVKKLLNINPSFAKGIKEQKLPGQK